MKLQVINSSGVPLRQATDGAAGIDLPMGIVINAREDKLTCDTQVVVAIPPGYCGLLIARSSLHKKGWQLANSVGVIDSDYRGSILLSIVPCPVRPDPYRPDTDDYVAQLVIVPVPAIEIEQVTELPETVRGVGGFGSTDVTKGEPQSPHGSTDNNRKQGVEL